MMWHLNKWFWTLERAIQDRPVGVAVLLLPPFVLLAVALHLTLWARNRRG